jgi:signal transduction histidine kinase
MGIGTYEARQYMRELGGQIEVESRETQGTIFRVTLPLYVPDRAAERSAAVENQG